MPTTILFADARALGGIESHLIALHQSLKARNRPVELWLWQRYDPSPFTLQLKSHGILPKCLDGNFRVLLSQLARMPGPIVLHTHGYKAGIIGRLAAVLSGTPVCATHHSGEAVTGRLRVYRWLDQALAPIGGNFAVSTQIAERLSVNARVISNFPVAQHRQRMPDDQIHFAFVGRGCRDKGIDRYEQLSQTVTAANLHWHHFGAGGDALGNGIVRHGPQLNMQAHYPKLDALILPSRHEGLPMAALEAMDAGLAVFAFDVGDLGRLVDDQVGGLFPAGDLNAMATALAQFAQRPRAARAQIGKAAHRRIRTDWNGDDTLDTLCDYYDRATAPARPGVFGKWLKG
ncbi:glycosyltransferase family 4 protein [Marinobacter hydrocarbonoclasticus]|nr:glycosyltransferase family 4 protein [Marinobacter nauticus]